MARFVGLVRAVGQGGNGRLVAALATWPTNPKEGKFVDIKKIAGENKGKVFLYALSTCGWCKKTKAYLNELGVEYSYVDVDLEKGAEREKALEQVRQWNPNCSFPTIVINDSSSMVGFQPDQLKEALGL